MGGAAHRWTPMQLTGIHHLTAVTADASRNHAFYTRTLGMRLVKKTVNQDDVSAYHLFYADGQGKPGTDLTFFDWQVPPERRGTGSIVRTGLRVATEQNLEWWSRRFEQAGIAQTAITIRDGRATLDFEDFEGQRLSLNVDGGRGENHPWGISPVPPEHQIRGLGPIMLSVPQLEATDAVLTNVLNMRRVREYQIGGRSSGSGGLAGGRKIDTPVSVYEMGTGGTGAELHLAVEPGSPTARQGSGGVHHVAFRTTVKDYMAWAQRLTELGMRSSGPVNRYYFQSLYFREPSGVLFEIATDEPGFAVDEPMETLGERLALPPFLEARRLEIEAGLKPLV